MSEMYVEWGVRYERKPSSPDMGGGPEYKTYTTVVQSEALARQAVENGAPLSARNRRVVSRSVTEWMED